MSSPSSSAALSPSQWIQQQQQAPSSMPSSRRPATVEPLTLCWPPASNWAAYSSVLASFPFSSLGNSSETNMSSSRSSPLTPTTPTYSPAFSPSFCSATASLHPQQPDSPHSVVDGFLDFSAGSGSVTTAFPLNFCLAASPKRQLLQSQESTAASIQPPNKRSKSFTIDAILGLQDLTCTAGTLSASSNASDHHGHQLNVSANDECDRRRVSPLSESSSSGESPSSPRDAVTYSSSTNSVVGAPSSSPRAKRVRTIFSAEQLERLEAEFARQQYMVGPERLVLAANLRLSESQVKVWFQNRRIKWRKQHLEAQQMRVQQVNTWRNDEREQSHHLLMTSGICDEHESFSD